MPSAIIGGCGVPINRSHVIFFAFDKKNTECIRDWMYNFADKLWVLKNQCQIQLEFGMIPVPGLSLECTAFFDKSAEM